MSSQSYDLPDPFYYNIGQIAAKWSAIEAELEFIILDAYEINQNNGLILSSQLGYRAKIELIRVLLNWKADHELQKSKEMFDLVAKVDEAYGRRNATVHSVWRGSAEPNIASRTSIRAKGKLKYGSEPVTIEELEADVEALRTLGRALRTAHDAKRFSTKDSNEDAPEK